MMTSVVDLPNDEEFRAMPRADEPGEDTAQQVGCGTETGVAVAQEERGAGGKRGGWLRVGGVRG